MGDRIIKNLARFSTHEQEELLTIMRSIEKNNLEGLNIKKLKETDDAYRVRKGRFRIIFIKTPNAENIIVAVEQRTESTYKNC